MLHRALPLAVSMFALASGAQAQSSLGIQSLSVDFGYGTTESGRDVLDGLAQLDVQVTSVHGLQLDIGLNDLGPSVVGVMGAHAYMHPVETQKYGLFVVLSDVDGRSIQYTNAGIEGRIALSDDTVVDLQFGIGGSTDLGGSRTAQWDYVFAGAGIMHNLTPQLRIDADMTLAEFDEADFRAIGLDTSLRLTHSARGSNFEVYAEVSNASLFGHDAAPSETQIGIGLTLNLGASADSLMDRPFSIAAPFDQLVTREIVASF